MCSSDLRRVELGGPAANTGTTSRTSVTTWQKQNSGCTWTEELRSETAGGWTSAGTVRGELILSEDGSYLLDFDPSWDEPPTLTEHTTDTVSDLSANCEGEGWDTQTPSGPAVPWASQLLAEYDIDLMQPQLTGRLDPTDPGSVVAGSGSWRMRDPEDTTLTVEWELVHDGPITLPHG